MIGADTSFLIDFLDEKEEALKFMKENKEQIKICEPVIFEFLCGNLTEEEKETFLAFISRFETFNLDRNATLKSSEIYREGKKQVTTFHNRTV